MNVKIENKTIEGKEQTLVIQLTRRQRNKLLLERGFVPANIFYIEGAD